ncbi:hypothetical protein [Aliiruegeria sabulilitoris]|uniref:hypothetical protein n=1 Tax=Aliiruegeria sabulilitoris TaxID=1510458 RepID=UPI000831A51E|nr:hypothetical protein [Aliiruegeria sabulilitoris]NDR56042.1 hypothetical protein [Pseudoruegeria sp. M32A2M]
MSRLSASTLLPLAIFLLVLVAMLLRVLPEALTDPWAITEDDGRHFVVWLRAMADPELFRDDPIAAYFGALTPLPYKWLFLPAVWLGIDVVSWQLLVLAPSIVALTLWAANRFLGHYFPDPIIRALCLALMVYVTMDDLVAGLPRSFAMLILFAGLLFYLERRLLALVLVLMLGANIYPAAAIVALSGIGMAGLIAFATERRIAAAEPLLTLAAVVATLVGLAIFLRSAGATGEVFSLAEARQMRIFGPSGRTQFFDGSGAYTAICSRRGGYLKECPDLPPVLALLIQMGGLTVALMILRKAVADARSFRLLPGLWAGATILFLLAYAVAFKAHLPTRYSGTGLSLLLPVGIAAVAGFLISHWRQTVRWIGLGLCWMILLGFAQQTLGVWTGDYFRDRNAELSAEIRALPKDSIIAGFTRYADFVPAYTGRAVYVSSELTVPYKKPYFELASDRVAVQGRLFSGPVDAVWHESLAQSGIDYFLEGSGTRSSWKRMALSFESLASWPGRTVFTQNPSVAAACRVAGVSEIDLIDAACFAAGLSGK